MIEVAHHSIYAAKALQIIMEHYVCLSTHGGNEKTSSSLPLEFKKEKCQDNTHNRVKKVVSRSTINEKIEKLGLYTQFARSSRRSRTNQSGKSLKQALASAARPASAILADQNSQKFDLDNVYKRFSLGKEHFGHISDSILCPC